MKLTTQNVFFMTLMVFSLMAAVNPLMAQVYKTVDENGHVTYTDRPPADGSKPMDLPTLSVVEVPVYEKTARESAKNATGEQNTEISLKNLRRKYRDFAIISPQNEESVWNPQQAVPVAWSVSNPLQDGMTVTLFIDGKKQSPTTQSIIPLAGLVRGAHTITAELVDARNRKIATAKPVTFFIKQPSVYNNRVGPGG